MSSSTRVFTRPLPVDSEAIDKCIVRTFDTEIKRRKYSIEDDYRDKRLDKVDVGKFDVAQISMHDLWQKRYLDTYGTACPLNADWKCPKCGTQFATGYPPEVCPICGYLSPIGEMARDGVFRR